MKKNIYPAFLAALLIAGCKNEVNLPDQPLENYVQVYMPQAVNGPVTKVLNLSDVPQEVVYGAYVSGYGENTKNIDVTFSVADELVDSFNTANSTSYELMPAKYYTLSASKSMIPAGSVSTEPLKILVKTGGDDALPMFRNYLLPIKLGGTAQKVNENLRTTFFVISAQPNMADYPEYDRTNWSIAGFSSEEANGEGPNNGRAVFILDNDINTFWHSRWQGANPGPPHYLAIDMGEVKTLHGIAMTARQVDGGGKPNEVKIEVSNDNVTWTEAGHLTFANRKDKQKLFLTEFVDARYFRFVIESAYSSTNAHLSELGAF